jgi:hypothetical protein
MTIEFHTAEITFADIDGEPTSARSLDGWTLADVVEQCTNEGGEAVLLDAHGNEVGRVDSNGRVSQ